MIALGADVSRTSQSEGMLGAQKLHVPMLKNMVPFI